MPLKTPDVLSSKRVPLTKVQNQISQTMQAFIKAQRQGFRLEDVGNAPLAKRRRLKRSLSRSSSGSDSSMSSYSTHGSLTPTKHLQNMSPMRHSPVMRNLSNLSNASSNSQNSTASQGFVPLKKSGLTTSSSSTTTAAADNSSCGSSGFFSFRESRIAALTPTLTNSPEAGSCSELPELGSSKSLDVAALDGASGNHAAVTAAASAPRVHAAKRKFEFSIQEIEDSDDDDEDCVIVCEEQGFVLKSTHCSDAANNNSSSSASSTPTRPRSDTIVIE